MGLFMPLFRRRYKFDTVHHYNMLYVAKSIQMRFSLGEGNRLSFLCNTSHFRLLLLRKLCRIKYSSVEILPVKTQQNWNCFRSRCQVTIVCRKSGVK